MNTKAENSKKLALDKFKESKFGKISGAFMDISALGLVVLLIIALVSRIIDIPQIIDIIIIIVIIELIAFPFTGAMFMVFATLAENPSPASYKINQRTSLILSIISFILSFIFIILTLVLEIENFLIYMAVFLFLGIGFLIQIYFISIIKKICLNS